MELKELAALDALASWNGGAAFDMLALLWCLDYNHRHREAMTPYHLGIWSGALTVSEYIFCHGNESVTQEVMEL